MRREAGFTLVEVLVVLSIVGIIGAVAAGAALQDVRLTASTAASLTGSAGGTALAGRLTDDLQGASAVGATGGPACGAAGTRVLWTRSASTTVAYAVTPGPRLLRTVCTDGSSAATVDLTGWAGDPAVQVTCDGGPTCTGATTLAADAPAAATTVSVTDPSALPAAPFALLVEGEQVTVTAVSGADLTVARAAPVDHAAGAGVRYAPRTVRVRVPATSFDLTVVRRAD